MASRGKNYIDRILGRNEGNESRDFGENRSPYGRDNLKTEGSMWNDRFYSERDRGSFYGKGPKGWKRSDERIKEDVSDTLYRDYHIDASDIEVEVKEGVVTLSGTVEDRDTKRAAEECIEHLSGIVDVHNRILIVGHEKFFQNSRELS